MMKEQIKLLELFISSTNPATLHWSNTTKMSLIEMLRSHAVGNFDQIFPSDQFTALELNSIEHRLIPKAIDHAARYVLHTIETVDITTLKPKHAYFLYYLAEATHMAIMHEMDPGTTPLDPERVYCSESELCQIRDLCDELYPRRLGANDANIIQGCN